MGDDAWTIFSRVLWLGKGSVMRLAARFARRFACRLDAVVSFALRESRRGLLDGGRFGESEPRGCLWGSGIESSSLLSTRLSFSKAVESFKRLPKSKLGSICKETAGASQEEKILPERV